MSTTSSFVEDEGQILRPSTNVKEKKRVSFEAPEGGKPLLGFTAAISGFIASYKVLTPLKFFNTEVKTRLFQNPQVWQIYRRFGWTMAKVLAVFYGTLIILGVLLMPVTLFLLGSIFLSTLLIY